MLPRSGMYRTCIPLATLQDFMGFLHLGWDVATKEEGDATVVAEESPAWAAVAARVDQNRRGLSIVRQTMAWHPLHVAAMNGDVDLIEELVQVSLCSDYNEFASLHLPATFSLDLHLSPWRCCAEENVHPGRSLSGLGELDVPH